METKQIPNVSQSQSIMVIKPKCIGYRIFNTSSPTRLFLIWDFFQSLPSIPYDVNKAQSYLSAYSTCAFRLSIYDSGLGDLQKQSVTYCVQ